MLGSVLDAGLVWLAVVGVVCAVIGAFYYIRLVWYMYFIEPETAPGLEVANDLRVVLSANALGLLALGLFPGILLDLCSRVLS